MKIIKAIYNFIVGDMFILVGVLIALVLLIIINEVSAFTAIRGFSGVLFIVMILGSLILTLAREAYSSKR